MSQKEHIQRARRILSELQQLYPGKAVFDLTGDGTHFVCEIEPTPDHPKYDRAIEVMIKTRPHKHRVMTQYYTVLKGSLTLHYGSKIVALQKGEKFTVEPNTVHWAESTDEAWVEIYSEPGWTAEDHIVVDLEKE